MPIRFGGDRRQFLRYGLAAICILFLLRYYLGPTVSTPQLTLDASNGRAPYESTNSTVRDHSPPNLAVLGQIGPSNTSAERLHVVISHHSEEAFYVGRWLSSLRAIPSVTSLGIHVYLYTKAPNADLALLQKLSTADTVIHLPNVGREGSTYLHHILTHWDALPQHTLFTQAILKNAQELGSGPTAGSLSEWLTTRLGTQFSPSVGFMSLDRKHNICHCGHCTDVDLKDEFYPLWSQLFSMMEGRVCSAHEPSVLSFNGHFIASKKRIKGRRRKMYEYLKELVDAPAGHWAHNEVEPKWFEKKRGPSRVDEPKFGHTLERLWHVMFRCADPAAVKDCNVEGLKAEGYGGCMCIDES